MQAAADKRADLDLQISLLAEHEVTRLIAMVAQIAQRLEVDPPHSPEELGELSQDIAPEKVLDTMEQQERKFETERVRK
jgi:uncharacterized membrane protein